MKPDAAVVAITDTAPKRKQSKEKKKEKKMTLQDGTDATLAAVC